MSRPRYSLLFLCAGAVTGCDPNGLTDPLLASCEDAGTIHFREVVQTALWRADDGPHHLFRTVEVTGTLTLTPGTLVCGAAGAEIRLRNNARLVAEGSEEAPIVFTAIDSMAPWGGIAGEYDPTLAYTIDSPGYGHAVTLRHARVEHAALGVRAGVIAIDSTLIRKTQGSGVAGVFGGGDVIMRASVVENACLGPGAAAIALHSGSPLLQDVRVFDSGCAGINAGLTRPDLLDVRIEGSAGPGLSFGLHYRGFYGSVGEVRSLRITGGASYPLYLMEAGAAVELLEIIPVDSLIGNTRDTLVVHGLSGAGVSADVRITALLPWLVVDQHSLAGLEFTGTVTMDAGAGLRIATYGPVRFGNGGRLLAEGTAENPVRITGSAVSVVAQIVSPPQGLMFLDSQDDTSRLTHALIEDLVVTARHPLLLSDVVLNRSPVRVSSGGSRLQRTRIIDSPGEGLSLWASDVQVNTCGITGSVNAGIVVMEPASTVRIRNCDIHGNGGPGLENLAAGLVDAELNWWGDADGPLGPRGDGVAGNVDFDPWLTHPIEFAQAGTARSHR